MCLVSLSLCASSIPLHLITLVSLFLSLPSFFLSLRSSSSFASPLCACVSALLVFRRCTRMLLLLRSFQTVNNATPARTHSSHSYLTRAYPELFGCRRISLSRRATRGLAPVGCSALVAYEKPPREPASPSF